MHEFWKCAFTFRAVHSSALNSLVDGGECITNVVTSLTMISHLLKSGVAPWLTPARKTEPRRPPPVDAGVYGARLLTKERVDFADPDESFIDFLVEEALREWLTNSQD